MTNWMQVFVGELPAWARRDDPALRHELGAAPPQPLRRRLLRAFSVILAALVLLAVGLAVATSLFTASAGQTLSETVNAVLYWVLLSLQVLLSILALTGTSSLVADALRKQNWDSLRVTELGTVMAMRARWVSIFYRLRSLLIVIIGARVVLVALMLWDLTGFRGRYLDLLINGITPTIPLAAAVLLAALLMTASLLLPLTAAGFDAALGLLIAAVVRQRVIVTLLQAVLILLRLAVMAALLVGVTQFLQGNLGDAADASLWLLVFGSGSLGDWGLSLLYLERASEIWAIIPYGVFLGVALLVFALVQAALADRILGIAARYAQRRD